MNTVEPQVSDLAPAPRTQTAPVAPDAWRKPHSRKMNPPAPVAARPTPERLMQFAWGYAPAIVLEAAIRHRIFDRLERTPRTREELAAESGLSVRGLKAVLDCLVGLELLRRENGRYALTPESSEFLVTGKPAYHGGFFKHTVSDLLPRWMRLDETLRTGKPAAPINEPDAGESFFAEFVESLFPLSYPAAKTLASHLRLKEERQPFSILDVGAGAGVWGIALAEESPLARILAVDWPKVLAITRRIAERHGLANRLSVASGDLLEADFGRGHKVAAIGHILHSEGPSRSQALLQRVFDALEPGGTVAIAEFLSNAERTGPPNALIFAVNMLIHTEEGDTFSFEEIAAWLSAAGFTNPRLLEAPGPSPLVLGTRP